MKSATLFPVRLLGFGFYWAWLFLVGVSPSPIVGLVTFEGMPFEALELFFRLLIIAVSIFASQRLSTVSGRKTLLALCYVAGPFSSVLLFVVTGPFIVGAALVMALADVAMFMLWLCFFGHMKVGETAVYMALSYAVGAVLFLAISTLNAGSALLCAAVLPLLSGISFSLANNYYSTKTGDSILFPKGIAETAEPSVFPYMNRLAISLGIYAFLFGLIASTAVCNNISSSLSGPLIEAPCCLLLGIVLAAGMKSRKYNSKLYLTYRIVPLLFAIGLALLLFTDNATYFIACTFIMLAYLAFEITALNDFCNAVKARNLSLMRTFGIARLAITTGMLFGWILSFGLAKAGLPFPPVLPAAALGMVALIFASTIVFTEREQFAVQGVSDEQIRQETARQAALNSEEFMRSLESFSDSWGISKREMEVLDLLLKGRNTQYIAEHLFIASGTTKTHIYNVYKKLGIHTRMELLDAFDVHCAEDYFEEC